MNSLDVRGMACPLPVVSVKRALESAEGELRVLLDDGAPRENVTRFAKGRGYQVQEAPMEGGFVLTISGEEKRQPAVSEAARHRSPECRTAGRPAAGRTRARYRNSPPPAHPGSPAAQ